MGKKKTGKEHKELVVRGEESYNGSSDKFNSPPCTRNNNTSLSLPINLISGLCLEKTANNY